jgi:hypothetical protein
LVFLPLCVFIIGHGAGVDQFNYKNMFFFPILTVKKDFLVFVQGTIPRKAVGEMMPVRFATRIAVPDQ